MALFFSLQLEIAKGGKLKALRNMLLLQNQVKYERLLEKLLIQQIFIEYLLCIILSNVLETGSRPMNMLSMHLAYWRLISSEGDQH